MAKPGDNSAMPKRKSGRSRGLPHFPRARPEPRGSLWVSVRVLSGRCVASGGYCPFNTETLREGPSRAVRVEWAFTRCFPRASAGGAPQERAVCPLPLPPTPVGRGRGLRGQTRASACGGGQRPRSDVHMGTPFGRWAPGPTGLSGSFVAVANVRGAGGRLCILTNKAPPPPPPLTFAHKCPVPPPPQHTHTHTSMAHPHVNAPPRPRGNDKTPAKHHHKSGQGKPYPHHKDARRATPTPKTMPQAAARARNACTKATVQDYCHFESSPPPACTHVMDLPRGRKIDDPGHEHRGGGGGGWRSDGLSIPSFPVLLSTLSNGRTVTQGQRVPGRGRGAAQMQMGPEDNIPESQEGNPSLQGSPPPPHLRCPCVRIARRPSPRSPVSPFWPPISTQVNP